jgi:hypothetical protein
MGSRKYCECGEDTESVNPEATQNVLEFCQEKFPCGSYQNGSVYKAKEIELAYLIEMSLAQLG